MPSVAELTGLYSNFLVAPRTGPDICRTCFNFTRGYARCYGCAHAESHLDAVAPISYSIGGEQLHRALFGYKRLGGDIARRLTVELAAVLWRFLARHERCVAEAAGVGSRFELVTTVPSTDTGSAAEHPLRHIVGDLAAPTRERETDLLRRSEQPSTPHEFDAHKYEAVCDLNGRTVLLIDDTWTTGANAQSAAAALKTAGAGRVGAVVIGRHVNREWHDNDRRLRDIAGPFDWERCPLCRQRPPR